MKPLSMEVFLAAVYSRCNIIDAALSVNFLLIQLFDCKSRNKCMNVVTFINPLSSLSDCKNANCIPCAVEDLKSRILIINEG